MMHAWRKICQGCRARFRTMDWGQKICPRCQAAKNRLRAFEKYAAQQEPSQ